MVTKPKNKITKNKSRKFYTTQEVEHLEICCYAFTSYINDSMNLRQKNNHFDHGHWNLWCSGEGKSIFLESDEKNCRKIPAWN